VRQRVDVDVRFFAVVVDILEDLVELVGRVDAIGLAAGLRPAGAADRRDQRQVRVGVDADQVKLELWRDDRLPALVVIEFQHLLQNIARRMLHRRVVGVEGVVDHLRGRVGVPGHHPDGIRVGAQIDVGILVRADIVLVQIGILAGHGLEEDAFRQAQAIVAHALGEFLRRQDLAAWNAVHVGDKALDLIDLAFVEPFFQVFHDNRLRWGRRQPPVLRSCTRPGQTSRSLEGLAIQAGRVVLTLWAI
jgi:hypothetical protein